MRIIQLQVTARTLLACYNLLELQKGDPYNTAPAECVGHILDSVISRLVDTGKILNVSEERAEVELIEILGEEEEDLDPLDSILDDLAPDEDLKERLYNAGQTPGIKPLAEPRSADEQPLMPPPILAAPPWEDVQIKRFIQLQQLAPKDALIETAAEERNELLQHAIECVYANIPMEMWGGDGAQVLVKSMMEELKPYMEKKDAS